MARLARAIAEGIAHHITRRGNARCVVLEFQKAGDWRFGFGGTTLLPPRLSPILSSVEVQFTPEQEEQLAQIATQAGTDAERLVKDAALRLLEQDARVRAAIREGIAQADRGEFIEEEEMDARLDQMLRS